MSPHRKKPSVVAPVLTSDVKERKVQHLKPTLKLYVGKDSLTSQRAKDLLGWTPEPNKINYGNEFLLKDFNGKKIRCHNNITNRPLYPVMVATLKQEILRKRWRLNGENRIIGRTGLVLNGQHTLVGLILAEQEWSADPDKYPSWTSPPVIETFFALGIAEDDDVVNTLDTAKPRKFSDVMYRSGYFANECSKDRLTLSRITDYAVRMLWHRTGASLDAFGLRRTHSESLDFIARHSKLLEAVRHIFEEDGKQHRISHPRTGYLSAGYAAGFLYLMGSCRTDPTEYEAADSPTEALLDWSMWDKACDFFVVLAGRADETKAIRNELARMIDDNGGSNAERYAILIKSWNCYVIDKPITNKEITLEYYTDEEDGCRYLDDYPTVGGIDLGEPSETDEEFIQQDDPTPEEIQERSSIERAKRISIPKQPKRKGDDWAKGDVAWVKDSDNEAAPYYLARLANDPYECDGGDSRVNVIATDGEWEVAVAELSLKKSAIKKTPKPKRKTTSKPFKPVAGIVCWVFAKDGKHWQGKIVDILGKNVKLEVAQGHKGAGNVQAARLVDLRERQPR